MCIVEFENLTIFTKALKHKQTKLKTEFSKSNIIANQAITILSAAFVIVWSLIIFTEFWNYDKSYSKALQSFQYYDLLILIIASSLGLSWIITKKGAKFSKYINGLFLFLGLLALNLIVICIYYSKLNGLDLKITGLTYHIGHFIGVASCVLMVYLVIRVLGNIFINISSLKISEYDRSCIESAIGIMIFTFIMFFLGVLGILNIYIF